MKTWLTRNWLPLLVIGVVLAVTAVTISIPQWKANPVSGHAAVAVSPGESYEMGGVTMRLKPVQLPPLEPAFGETTAGRDVAFLLTREHDGAPAGPPDGTIDCQATFSDGRRQWRQGESYEVEQWAESQGYTTECWDVGPLLVSMTVPDDAHISLVGIAFRKNVEVAEDEAMPDPSALWTVVEFQA